MSSASLQTLQLRLEEIHQELTARHHEDTGVHRVNTRVLTDQLAGAMAAAATNADEIVRLALRRLLWKLVGVIALAVTTVTGSAIAYLQAAPSPDVAEVREKVEEKGSAIEQDLQIQKRRTAELESQILMIRQDMAEGFTSMGGKLDALTPPEKPDRPQRRGGG